MASFSALVSELDLKFAWRVSNMLLREVSISKRLGRASWPETSGTIMLSVFVAFKVYWKKA